MRTCENCSDEPEYSDRDDLEHYCEEHFKQLDQEYVKANGITKQ